VNVPVAAEIAKAVVPATKSHKRPPVDSPAAVGGLEYESIIKYYKRKENF